MKTPMRCVLVIGFLLTIFSVNAQQTTNRPERVEWYENLAFGMFIHWNVDVALGGVISHSLAGASDDYAKRYFTELPDYFDPTRFDATVIAKKAKLAGMKYVVFTTKHHSGFCMFSTKTTPFNVINTPYGKDITKQIVDAFRKEGIAIGFYFSPEDFYFFHQHNIPMGRLQVPEQFPANNPALMDYDKRQLHELLTNYGKIDILFIDGPGDGIREYAWSLNPDLVITRDVMNTPEQNTPDAPLPRPWEACYTTGTEWSFKASNDDTFKSGTEVINKLIEIRSKGGNFLLNVGPTSEGIIQEKEANVLTEIGLWMFANSESIYNIKPLPVIREGHYYFTQSNDGKSIYAYIIRKDPSDWSYGTRRTFTFSHLSGSASSRASVLGYGSKLVEYRKGFDAGVYTMLSPVGLTISAVNGQRFYTDNQWPNAVVLKIDGATFQDNKAREKRSNIDGAK